MSTFGERYRSWFHSGAAVFVSAPVFAAVTLTSHRHHSGPYRWLMEAQGAALGGFYSVSISLAVIFVATHFLVCSLVSLVAMPPVFLRNRRPMAGISRWVMQGRKSFYAAGAGTTLLGIAVATGAQALFAGELVLGKPSVLATSTPTWAYIDGKPHWKWTVTKDHETFVAYVDAGNDGSGPGVIVISVGGLGLRDMQTADRRNLGIEAMRLREGVPPSVRAAFIEHGMAWVSEAPAFRYGNSPVTHKKNAMIAMTIGLALLGLGVWRRPR